MLRVTMSAWLMLALLYSFAFFANGSLQSSLEMRQLEQEEPTAADHDDVEDMDDFNDVDDVDDYDEFTEEIIDALHTERLMSGWENFLTDVTENDSRFDFDDFNSCNHDLDQCVRKVLHEREAMDTFFGSTSSESFMAMREDFAQIAHGMSLFAFFIFLIIEAWKEYSEILENMTCRDSWERVSNRLLEVWLDTSLPRLISTGKISRVGDGKEETVKVYKKGNVITTYKTRKYVTKLTSNELAMALVNGVGKNTDNKIGEDGLWSLLQVLRETSTPAPPKKATPGSENKMKVIFSNFKSLGDALRVNFFWDSPNTQRALKRTKAGKKITVRRDVEMLIQSYFGALADRASLSWRIGRQLFLGIIVLIFFRYSLSKSFFALLWLTFFKLYLFRVSKTYFFRKKKYFNHFLTLVKICHVVECFFILTVFFHGGPFRSYAIAWRIIQELEVQPLMFLQRFEHVMLKGGNSGQLCSVVESWLHVLFGHWQGAMEFRIATQEKDSVFFFRVRRIIPNVGMSGEDKFHLDKMDQCFVQNPHKFDGQVDLTKSKWPLVKGGVFGTEAFFLSYTTYWFNSYNFHLGALDKYREKELHYNGQRDIDVGRAPAIPNANTELTNYENQTGDNEPDPIYRVETEADAKEKQSEELKAYEKRREIEREVENAENLRDKEKEAAEQADYLKAESLKKVNKLQSKCTKFDDDKVNVEGKADQKNGQGKRTRMRDAKKTHEKRLADLEQIRQQLGNYTSKYNSVNFVNGLGGLGDEYPEQIAGFKHKENYWKKQKEEALKKKKQEELEKKKKDKEEAEKKKKKDKEEAGKKKKKGEDSVSVSAGGPPGASVSAGGPPGVSLSAGGPPSTAAPSAAPKRR